MRNSFISIVIPTYKEAKNIKHLLESIDHALQSLNYAYEVVIVDDNSNDGIEDLVIMLSKKFPVKIKIRILKKDLSASVIEGIKMSKGDILVVMDGDLSHPPSKLPDLVKPIIDKKYDISIGSRFIEGADIEGFGFFRRMNAFVSRILARPLVKVSDPMSGFFAFRKSIIPDYEILTPVGFKIGLEILVKSGSKKITEVPIIFAKRYAGKSKLSTSQQFKYIQHLCRLLIFKIRT